MNNKIKYSNKDVILYGVKYPHKVKKIFPIIICSFLSLKMVHSIDFFFFNFFKNLYCFPNKFSFFLSFFRGSSRPFHTRAVDIILLNVTNGGT